MKISCYVPLCNNADTIAYCLDSLLRQSLAPEEILVVDDASSDQSPQIAARYPVKLIRHPGNRGLAAVRNTALKNISGEFVASIDADCTADSGWLESLAGALSSSPRAAGAGGRVMETQASSVFDLWRAAHMRQFWEENETTPGFLFGANTLFRSDNLRMIGLYDESLGNNAEDVDICCRLKASGSGLVYCHNAVVYHQKKDSLRSLFNSHWNWHRSYYEKAGWFRNDFSVKIKENLGTANRYLEEDIAAGRHQLLYLDFLLGMFYSLKDFLYIKDSYITPSSAVLWAALADLRLSEAFSRGNNRVFRFDCGEAGYAADFLAATLSIGGEIKRKFPNKDFLALIYGNLLEAVYGIEDRQLSGMMEAFSSINWDWLRDGNYPLSGEALLSAFKEGLSSWLDIVVTRSGDTPTWIQLASREQASRY
ncbi:MAG: glycosyltransferase [Candidatus Omnitrophota bacterium]|jgi:glycosyltransferase involved in cell wall biosynthesis